MEWDLEEAVAHYRRMGAPGDQGAVIGLLREVQRENGGSIPVSLLAAMADGLGVKESLLRALIRRIPSLRLSEKHCLELCAGPNCGRRGDLAAFVERTYGKAPEGFTLRYVPCMRLCGKGPNIRWDGTVYHGADEALIRALVERE